MAHETMVLRRVAASAALVLGGSALGGCFSSESSESLPQPTASAKPAAPEVKTFSDCKKKDNWKNMPPGFLSVGLDKFLHVTPRELAEGSWGPAICEEGVLGDEITNVTTRARVHVDGFDNACIAVGVKLKRKNEEISAATPYTDLLVACPANPTATL